VIPGGLDFSAYDFTQAGEPHRLSDYAVGEMIDHVDGVTIEEAEHMMATRLWQNTSKTHFDATPREDRKRLIYGGHVMSMARALSFNGLANAQCIVAINAGSHANPCFAGDTVRAWSEVLDTARHPRPGSGRSGCGWWPPRTGPRSVRSRARTASTCRTFCWISTTGR
jgi:2-methylfumaryl-CoA hydratase